MRITKALLGVAVVPLLSGCMMWPMAHTGDVTGLAAAAEGEAGQRPAQLRQAEASGDGLTITLSVLPPSRGTATVFDAQLRTDGAPDELAEIDTWLRIQLPGGGVDQVVMRRVPSHAKAWHHAEYRFPAAGSYLVTAEARTGSGTEVRTVSVTTEVYVGNGSHGDRRDWLVPVAVLGGLGTMVWMALVMGGSRF